MSEMPSKSLLQAALSESFLLRDDHGTVVNVELLSVNDGVPMNNDYVCYSALFALPSGMAASQGTYRISRGNGEAWSLFMSPIMSDAAGRTRLEALFHYQDAVGVMNNA
jgi:hypothetical protein